MKKLRLFALLFITVSLAFTACKKDEDAEKEKSCLLGSIKEVGDDDVSVFEYDSQNRIVKIKYYDHAGLGDNTTITYNSSEIIIKHFDANILEGTKTYPVSNGVVTGQTGGYSYQENGYTITVTGTYTYQHNSAGYLTKTNYTETYTSNQVGFNRAPSTSVVTYTYQDGNLITEVRNADNLQGTSTTSYEYYANITNTILDDDEDDIVLTKPNKNAVKKITESYSSNQNISIYNFTYEVNADNLITKSTRMDNQGQLPSSNVYEYNCN